MRKVVCLTGILCLMVSLVGCSNKVNKLIEEGKYEEALYLIEEDPTKYSEIIDEVKYIMALELIENGEYVKALDLLEEASTQYSEIIDEVKYNIALECIENDDFDKALEFLEENSYENASNLLKETLNLRAASDIEKCLYEMDEIINDYNPDTWVADFDYMEASDFYTILCDSLNDTYDALVKYNDIKNVETQLIDIFGFVPDGVEEAKKIIDEFKDELEYDEFCGSSFFNCFVLNYVMTELGRDSEYTRFEMTDTSGFFIVEKPYEFLSEKSISAKTFAYLLGTCIDYGAIIERESDKIIVTYENVQRDEFYSRGYFYCAPDDQTDKLNDFWEKNETVELYDIYLNNDSLEMKIILNNENGYDFKYMSFDVIISNEQGKHVQMTSKLLKNISDEDIRFSIVFDDFVETEFPDGVFNIHIYPGTVLNK